VIDTVVQIAMSAVLICGAIAIGVSLIRMHRNPDAPSLSDLITATDKKGKKRLDARKCFEAGSFALTTWVMIYITLGKGMTIEFFTVFLGVWTTARFLRDREQRLSREK